MFRRRRHNLWDDSDDEESGNNNPSNIEVIDLTDLPESNASTIVVSTQSNQLPTLPPPILLPLPSVSSIIPQIMAPYVPRTLQQNSRRHSILPAFPSSFYNDRPPLLLANVPIHKLNQEQLARRQPGVYPLAYTINPKNFDIPSDFRNNHQSFISSLVYQYNVEESILDYNLYRFSECFRTFADECMRLQRYSPERFELTGKQKKYALEFYLQVDVDLFFMKTCSFRNAKARTINEGLFCIDEPDIRYGLSPCNNCLLCVPPYHVAHRHQPTMRFGPSQTFRFINGYQTILNCPADCQTRNIIYVMTCPCGEFEYIGQTSQRLGDRLRYHRQHVNRIIHEFLIGEENVKLSRTEDKDFETLAKDRMLLYKHAARCPSIIQIFLNFNAIYSCFIPITANQAARQSRTNMLPSSLVLLDSVNPTSIASKDRRDIRATADTRADEPVRSCMRDIPPIPPGYTYSIGQRVQQFQYFKDKLDVTTKQDEFLDLFDVAIIAVLPIDASEIVRKFVESLFITHTEAKLNKAGHLIQKDGNDDDGNDDDDNDNNNHILSIEAQILDRGEWCRNIVFPNY